MNLTKRLLQILVFLIPTNLSYHWILESSYINGRLIDYLIPSLYLQDIVLVLLLGAIVYNKLINVDKSDFIQLFKSVLRSSTLQIFFIFIIYLLVVSAFTPSAISAFLIIFRASLLYLCGNWIIKTYSKQDFLSLIIPPLIVGIISQSIIGLSQYINQSSVFGYLLLGEPDLSSALIAKTQFRGFLEVAPYGTTPHPNILAGFIVTAMIIIFNRTPLLGQKFCKKAISIIVIGFSLAILTIIQSISALSGLISVVVMLKISKIISIRKFKLLFLIIIVSSQILSVLFINTIYHLPKYADNRSITDRYELNSIAINSIVNNPPWGSGVNTIIRSLPEYPLGKQTSFLLQPPHHVGLILLAEIGFIGMVMIIYLMYVWYKQANRHKPYFPVFLPLTALTIISGLDHYPVTLPTGQYLLMLTFTLPLLQTSKKSVSNHLSPLSI